MSRNPITRTQTKYVRVASTSWSRRLRTFKISAFSLCALNFAFLGLVMITAQMCTGMYTVCIEARETKVIASWPDYPEGKQ